ncbi:MAG: hypothetical protein PUP93_29975 [Rhizonema sp. NSF051]|nr:hypothetical protein [Rhizonema sp. NSF051]
MTDASKTSINPQFNSSAWKKLPSATAQTVEAVLLNYSIDKTKEDIAYIFGVNPATTDYDYSAEYSAVPTVSTNAPHQVFNYSTGGKLTLSDMVLNAYVYGKSLRPLIEGAIALTKAQLSNNKYAPPILTFRMGTEILEPCVLLSVKYVREASLGGEPARIKLSMTLQQIPKQKSKAEKEAQAKKQQQDTANRNVALNKPPMPLSLRQQNDTKAGAKSFLGKYANLLDPSIGNAYKAGDYAFLTDAVNGTVSLFTGKTNQGVVVQNNGKLISGGKGVTSIKTKAGVSLPTFSQTLKR